MFQRSTPPNTCLRSNLLVASDLQEETQISPSGYNFGLQLFRSLVVERAVAGGHVNVAVSIGRRSHAAAPNPAAAIIRSSRGIGRGAENSGLLEIGIVVA